MVSDRINVEQARIVAQECRQDGMPMAAQAIDDLTDEIERLRSALTDMAYGYLRIQESDKQSAFAGRAFKAACELVEVDTSKSWVSEDELSRLAEGHDCARRAIDTGALEQVGFGGCKRGAGHVSYWHGGPTVRGDMLQPPTVTGHSRSGNDEAFVYVTPVRSLAETYAATCRGWVYEVEPVGALEQDPDSILPVGQSLRCPAARIVRRFRLSRAECDRMAAAVRIAADLRGIARGAFDG